MCTEFWDAYSGDGQKLGYTIKRTASENIPDGVYHIVVRVYVFREDGFLLTTMRDEKAEQSPYVGNNRRFSFGWREASGGCSQGTL